MAYYFLGALGYNVVDELGYINHVGFIDLTGIGVMFLMLSSIIIMPFKAVKLLVIGMLFPKKDNAL